MNELQSKMKQAGARSAKRFETKMGLFHFSIAQFLIALILLLLSYPFVVDFQYGPFIENVLMMVIMVLAVLAVGSRAWVLTILLVIPALTGPWMDHHWPGLVPFWIISCAHMLFVGFVVAKLLRFILRSIHVNAEVMCAGISGYLMIGLLWTSAFIMVSQLNPASFSGAHVIANQPLERFDALYLSFTTLTCLGGSDITPVSKVARMLLMVESTTGVLYVAVLIARLVALYSSPVGGNPDNHSKPQS